MNAVVKTTIVFIALAAVAASLALSIVERRERQRVYDNAQSLSGGNAREGRHLLKQYGCGSCHDIPGVAGARGTVGPPLGTMAERSFVGGVLPHNPSNLVRWIVNPQGIDSLTAMPTLGVTEQEARHMAAYLYTLGK